MRGLRLRFDSDRAATPVVVDAVIALMLPRLPSAARQALWAAISQPGPLPRSAPVDGSARREIEVWRQGDRALQLVWQENDPQEMVVTYHCLFLTAEGPGGKLHLWLCEGPDGSRWVGATYLNDDLVFPARVRGVWKELRGALVDGSWFANKYLLRDGRVEALATAAELARLQQFLQLEAPEAAAGAEESRESRLDHRNWK